MKRWWFYLGLYSLLLFGYSVFSYSLTDPNLVLTSWPPYWQFQNWMWQIIWLNKPLLTTIFILFVTTLLSTAYCLLSILRKKKVISWKLLVICLITLSLPPLFSYNALSHDVFNYLFNAKIVVEYQANPHFTTALTFANDDWLRFMHNTHTPAPYGYGWTAISLIPYLLGLGKFSLSWVVMTIWMASSVWLLALTYWWLDKRGLIANRWWVAAVLLNPFLLIEVISNSHNDLWMMVPALLSVGLMLGGKQLTASKVGFSLLLLLFSISIKLATLVLIPIWVLSVIYKSSLLSILLTLLRTLPSQIINLQSSIINLSKYFPILSSLALFTLLLTPRSQQFLPWYWLWVLIWAPLFPKLGTSWLDQLIKAWQWTIVVVAPLLLLRYVPFLYTGEFLNNTLFWQKMITWCVIGLVFVLSFVWQRSRSTS